MFTGEIPPRGSFVLDRAIPVPLYHQLREGIRKRIVSGEWKVGQMIPTEDELCLSYQVSKATVRKALDDLVARGLIHRFRGKGTFVSKQRLEHGPIELTGFTEEMERRGLRPSSRVLGQQIEPAPPDVASALGLEPGTLVIVLRRLRLADGEPMGLQTAHIPHDLCPGLLEDDLSGSLYQLLENKYRVPLIRGVEKHYAALIPKEAARLLHVPPGSVALAAERITYTTGRRPVELVHSLMRGDRFEIVLHLVGRL